MLLLRLGFLLLTFLASTLAQSPFSLKFIADFNIATGVEFSELTGPSPAVAPSGGSLSLAERLRRKSSGGFGGISGIAYAQDSGLLYALSDSSKPTVFVLEFEIVDKTIHVTPKNVLRLTDDAGAPVPLWTLDPEGIALSREGVLFIASEGYVVRRPVVDPGVFRFDLEGRLLGSIQVPGHYLPRGEGDRAVGVRHNRGFESLSLSLNGGSLFAAAEDRLAQDSDDCGVTTGCTARILRYEMTSDGEEWAGEHFYRKDLPELPDGFGPGRMSMGLSEILAVDDRRLLTLERGFAPGDDGRTHQVVRVYQVDLPHRPAENPTVLEKHLVLDLSSVQDEFSPGFRTLDNYEGMCFGPPLDSGRRTVLMISDNNYSERQRTSILAFELIED